MSGSPPDPHLSERDLSDLVDGLGDAMVEDHARECAACSARLERWRSMSDRLSGLDSHRAVPVARQEEAVAAALAAATARAEAPSGAGRPGRHLRTLTAAAAAAGVLAVAGFGVAHLGHAGGGKSAGHGRSAVSASSGPGAAAARPAPQDLGSLSGPAELTAAVERVLGGSSGSAAAPNSAGTSSAGTSSAGTSSAGTNFSGAASPAGGSGLPGPLAAGTAAACPDTGRLFPGASPQLLLKADATYQGTPAAVYVYQTAAGRRAVVVDARTCVVLADVPA